MSWLSSIFNGVSKAVTTVVKDVAPILTTVAQFTPIGGTLGAIAKAGAAVNAAHPAGGVSPIMSLSGQEGMPGVPGVATTAAPLIDFSGAINSGIADIESYTSAASHNIQQQGVRLGIYAVLILFMLAAFFALLMPDESQTVNIADKAGDLAAVG